MTSSTRFRDMPAGILRSAAAAAALALLATAADAAMLYNSSGSTMRFYLYNQNDASAAVSCFDTELPANSQVSFAGFPGTCGLYQKVKVKGVATKSLTETGATCWGFEMGSGGEARISGGYDNCTVNITP